MAVMWGNAPTINPVAISSIGDSYFQGQKHKRDNELLDARKAYGQAINPDGSFNYSQALGLAAKAGDTESLFNFNLANQGSEEFGWKREDRDLTKEAINSATGLLGGGIAEGGRYSAALFPQGSPSPQPSASPSGGAIYKGLIDRGFAPHQAAAITGNIQQESSFKPDAWNSKEGAGGLIQWRLDRLENLKKFAAQNGKNWNDIDTQLDFIKYEMSGPEARAGSAFMAAKDLPSANAALKGYIRYGDQTQPGRLAYASAYLPGNPAVMSDASPPGLGAPPSTLSPEASLQQSNNQAALAQQKPPPGFGNDPSRVPTENLLQIISNPRMPPITQQYALALLQQRMPQAKKYGFIQGQDNSIYRTDEGSGQVDRAIAGSPAPLFSGNSVEAQSLNWLVSNKKLTPEQATQLGAGKTITGPSGEMLFMTPNGVFGQSAGQFAAPFGQDPQPPQPTGNGQPGMIALTGPKQAQPGPLPAEIASRIGLANQFLTKDLPEIQAAIQGGALSGASGTFGLATGIGKAGEINIRVASGLDALRRNLTGAGMSASEADDYVKRYVPAWNDSAERINAKLNGLKADLESTRDAALAGRKIDDPALTGQSETPPRVSSPNEYASLPSGSTYMAPDGTIRRKP